MSADDVEPANPVSNVSNTPSNSTSQLGLVSFSGIEEADLQNNTRHINPITVTNTNNVSFNANLPSSFSHYHSSLKERIGDLYESSIFSDVIFKVGGKDTAEAEFKGHKLILAISSPVFAAMFYGSLESENVITIPDCKPAAFRVLLQFAYKGELNISEVQLALDVLYAARKYSMRLLEDECMVYLCGHVSFESVLAVKEAAENYQLPVLELICKEYIEDHSYNVLKYHFPFLNLETLLSFIQNDRLNIQEIDLFLILADWASQELDRKNLEKSPATIRKVIEPCLTHMRFPTMQASDFADHVVPTGILTTDEVAQIFTYISATNKDKHDAGIFPTTKRFIKPGATSAKSTDLSSNENSNNCSNSNESSTPGQALPTRSRSRGHSRKRSRNRL